LKQNTYFSCNAY